MTAESRARDLAPQGSGSLSTGPFSYPVELDLAGRSVVVVGGGVVALRRTQALIGAGALVTVIAPEVADEFSELPVAICRRRYREGDLAQAWLAHAVTDDRFVNAAVAAEAERSRIWCVRADDAEATTARIPAVTRHGEVTVAVTSGDPRRSQRLRSAISLALADGGLDVRPHRSGHRPAACSSVRPPADRLPAPSWPGARSPRLTAPRRPVRIDQAQPRVGSVALVGGGPGDPELITVRGRRLLAQADVVVADRLGPRELLAELGPDVEVIEAGKAPGAHSLTQDQINSLIVGRARAGSRVVRLKGGDPFVFGRGGEEALACARAGVPFEVVPGITSAVAVPACAGIPVTHRGITQEFSVISAHLDPSAPESTVDWEALAAGRGTLVLLMAVSHLDSISADLIRRGRDAATPVALIQDGTTPRQRVLTSTLERAATDAARHGIRPPAVIVIGDVVGLRQELGRFGLAEPEAPATSGAGPDLPGQLEQCRRPSHYKQGAA